MNNSEETNWEEIYEMDREDMAVNERWAEDHGYSRYRCAVHGTFWSDSADECPTCGPMSYDDEPEGDYLRIDSPETPTNDQVCLELMLNSWQARIERAARETTQGSFLMQALRRNGVL